MSKKAKVTGDSMWTSRPGTSHFIDSFWFDTISTTSVLPITDTEPLLFYIPGLEKIHIIMDQIWMNIKIKILQKDGGQFKKMKADNKAFPINSLFYTLFEDFELYLNDEKAISTRGAYQVILSSLICTASGYLGDYGNTLPCWCSVYSNILY